MPYAPYAEFMSARPALCPKELCPAHPTPYDLNNKNARPVLCPIGQGGQGIS